MKCSLIFINFIQNQQLLAFLVVILLAIFAGFVLVLKVIRAMGGGGHYQMAPMVRSGYGQSHSGSSNDLLVTVALLAGASVFFWFSLIGPNDSLPNNRNKEAKSKLEQTYIQEDKEEDTEEEEDEEVNSIEYKQKSTTGFSTFPEIPDNPPPESQIVQREIPVDYDATTSNLQVTNAIAIEEYFTIQVSALSNSESAKKEKSRLLEIHDEVYILEEGGQFKLTIGLFPNRASANTYKKHSHLEGFLVEVYVEKEVNP